MAQTPRVAAATSAGWFGMEFELDLDLPVRKEQ